MWESSDDCELMGHNRSPYSSNDDLFLGIKIMQTKWSKSKETNLQSCNFSRPFYLKKHSLDKEIFGGPSSLWGGLLRASISLQIVLPQSNVKFNFTKGLHAMPFFSWLFAAVLGSKIPGLEILGIKMINVQVVKQKQWRRENTYNFAAQMICCCSTCQ